jgi:hypothetical protein
MRVVYVAGDGPLEGASYALEDRLPITEELELDTPDGGPIAVYRVGQDCKLWFVHLLPPGW